MIGLGQCATTARRSQRARTNAHRELRSRGKSSLPYNSLALGRGESAALHSVRKGPLCQGDKTERSDYPVAVVRTVEALSVAGIDAPGFRQEKEAWSVGGTPFQ